MTIILSIFFGAIVGVGIMGIFSGQAYEKGYADGQKIIYIRREEVSE